MGFEFGDGDVAVVEFSDEQKDGEADGKSAEAAHEQGAAEVGTNDRGLCAVFHHVDGVLIDVAVDVDALHAGEQTFVESLAALDFALEALEFAETAAQVQGLDFPLLDTFLVVLDLHAERVHLRVELFGGLPLENFHEALLQTDALGEFGHFGMARLEVDAHFDVLRAEELEFLAGLEVIGGRPEPAHDGADTVLVGIDDVFQLALALEILLEGQRFEQLVFGAEVGELAVQLREVNAGAVPLLLQEDEVVLLLPVEELLFGFPQVFFQIDNLVGDGAEGYVGFVGAHRPAVGDEFVHHGI